MKKSISVVAIAALFAVGAAFTTRLQSQWWNVNAPESGSPGIYNLTVTQVKSVFCPGVSNIGCAYLISNTSTIVKKP